MRECILELVNISCSYDGEQPVIKNINLKLYEGEKVAILGNNGAGKSTFFLCLNGILPLQEGKMIYRGKELTRRKGDLTTLRKKVGLVFQDPDNQIIASTVESEISFGLVNMNLEKEEIRNRIEQITEELDLTRYRKSPPHYLSGGEKKRVSIADILVMKPEILLFDEPTASLDSKHIAVFEEILDKQNTAGMITLISTHDIDFAWRWADRIIVFHQGEIQEDDVPRKIFAKDELLQKTSIKKPTLYRITEILCKSKGIDIPEIVPKDDKMLEAFVKDVEGI